MVISIGTNQLELNVPGDHAPDVPHEKGNRRISLLRTPSQR